MGDDMLHGCARTRVRGSELGGFCDRRLRESVSQCVRVYHSLNLRGVVRREVGWFPDTVCMAPPSPFIVFIVSSVSFSAAWSGLNVLRFNVDGLSPDRSVANISALCLSA